MALQESFSGGSISSRPAGAPAPCRLGTGRALGVNAKPVARWRIISASAPGTAHLEKTLPCQDAHAFCVLPGGELLAAVSDGAGSAEHAREGANLAVEGALAGLNALCFGWVHLLYGSWISVLLSIAAGGLFAWLYLRHRNLWAVTIVHSLFGVAVFAMGYGMYFYHGRQ